MKNTIVFIFLLFSISAFSQQNKWDVGIVGGAGVTTIRRTNSNWYQLTPTVGFYTGLSVQYNFNEHFALHTELAFDRKGTKDEYTSSAPDGTVLSKYTVTNQLNYLTLPILFRASLGNKTKYFLQAGPYLSYLLNYTIKRSSSTTDDPLLNASINRTSETPSIDFGMSAGLGAVIPVKEKFAVSCELRGNYGFVDLYSKGNANTQALNQSLNFLVGVTYKLGN